MSVYDTINKSSDKAKKAIEVWAIEFDKDWLGLVSSIRKKPRIWFWSGVGIILLQFVLLVA